MLGIGYSAGRMDTDPDTGKLADSAYEAIFGLFTSRAYCLVDSIKIPLIDLFAPRGLCDKQPWSECMW